MRGALICAAATASGCAASAALPHSFWSCSAAERGSQSLTDAAIVTVLGHVDCRGGHYFRCLQVETGRATFNGRDGSRVDRPGGHWYEYPALRFPRSNGREHGPYLAIRG